jgi:hypothetical protein
MPPKFFEQISGQAVYPSSACGSFSGGNDKSAERFFNLNGVALPSTPKLSLNYGCADSRLNRSAASVSESMLVFMGFGLKILAIGLARLFLLSPDLRWTRQHTPATNLTSPI